MTEIDRLCRRYLLQTYLIAVVLTLLVMGVEAVFHRQSLVAPITVSVVFSLVIEKADILIWRLVNRRSPDGLTTFYSAVSGFRMLLALAALFGCYLAVGRAAMGAYVAVFMTYYVVYLAHHAIFFSRVSNNRDKLSK